jgi:hypothetical protein
MCAIFEVSVVRNEEFEISKRNEENWQKEGEVEGYREVTCKVQESRAGRVDNDEADGEREGGHG